MNLSLTSQIQGFVISVVVGAFLGAYYDIFRIIRTVFQSERRVVFFQDLFYMFSAAFVTFLLALGVNYGEVRFYILAGEVIGWCLYYLTVGVVTIHVFKVISKLLHMIIIDPIEKIISAIYRLIFSTLKVIIKNIKIVLINWQKRLKQHNDIVYNNFISKRKKNGKA